MISNAPLPVIIIFPTPTAGIRWIGGSKKIPTQKPRNPHRPKQPIPSFDRRALRERVDRVLKQNRPQHEQLRAAHWRLPPC
jgi:hypothetical protein